MSPPIPPPRQSATPRRWLALAVTYALAVAVATALAPLIAGWILVPSLAVFSVFSWRAWRAGSSPFGGAPILIYFAGCAAYIVGSVRLADEAPYANEIPEQQWLLYLWAALAAAIALALGLLLQSKLDNFPVLAHTTFSSRSVTFPAWALYLPAAVGLGVTWVNFLTGRIPLLSDSINVARREGTDALLSDWSFASYPTLEFVIIAAAVLPLRNVSHLARIAVLAVSVSTLVLTGSRSFLVFPIVALALIFIESKRPRLVLVVATAAVLALLVAIAGQLRSFASGTGDNVISNAEKWGYGPIFTSSILSNLQVGPHVFAAVQAVIPSEIPFQQGVFFLRDFPKLSAGTEADYWITETVLKRDSEANGGLPPTILGGFYVDWGFIGAVVGIAVVFLALGLLRPRPLALFRSQPRTIAYAIISTYVLTAYYSYISLNVGLIMMLLWCVFLTIARRAEAWRVRITRRRAGRARG